MAKSKYIATPDKMWELPLQKNGIGNYIVVPPKRQYSGITSVNKSNNPNGYIYFVKAKDYSFYKLGVSANVKRRICDIDSYLPFDLEILSLHRLNDVYEVEELIQKKFKQYKIRREWYNLTIEQAKEIMIELHNINVKQDGCTKSEPILEVKK